MLQGEVHRTREGTNSHFKACERTLEYARWFEKIAPLRQNRGMIGLQTGGFLAEVSNTEHTYKALANGIYYLQRRLSPEMVREIEQSVSAGIGASDIINQL